VRIASLVPKLPAAARATGNFIHIEHPSTKRRDTPLHALSLCHFGMMPTTITTATITRTMTMTTNNAANEDDETTMPLTTKQQQRERWSERWCC
jgi:hypothetical protein